MIDDVVGPSGLPLRARINAWAVIREGDDILLSRWVTARRPSWTFPGSFIDAGEDPRHAAARHTLDETGFVVVPGRLLHVHSRVIPASRTSDKPKEFDRHITNLAFEASIVGGELIVPSAEKTQTDEARWFSVDALPNNLYRTVSIVLGALQREK